LTRQDFGKRAGHFQRVGEFVEVLGPPRKQRDRHQHAAVVAQLRRHARDADVGRQRRLEIIEERRPRKGAAIDQRVGVARRGLHGLQRRLVDRLADDAGFLAHVARLRRILRHRLPRFAPGAFEPQDLDRVENRQAEREQSQRQQAGAHRTIVIEGPRR
jgi:hypothetical protein